MLVKNIFIYIQIFLWENQFHVFTSWYLSLLDFKQTYNDEIFWLISLVKFSRSFYEVTKILTYQFMNRAFLTKRSVSLDTFIKQAKSEEMCLGIPLIFVTKISKFLLLFKKSFLFPSPIFMLKGAHHGYPIVWTWPKKSFYATIFQQQ